MDTLTHALSGALIARATAPGNPGPTQLATARRVAIGFLAGAFPDIDIVGAALSPVAYLYHHRGITHSILLLPLWAWLLALLSARLDGSRLTWRAYFGVIALAIAAHIAGDLITSFGTMILAPFSDRRFELSTTFIIDLWFTGIILAGLLASALWRRSRVPAVIASCVLVGYVGLQWAARGQAIDFGERHAQAAGYTGHRVSALPRPASPFHWMVIVERAQGYDYAMVSLTRREPVVLPPDAGFFARIAAPYEPPGTARWERVERYGAEPALSEEAWSTPALEFFRWFAAFPMVYRVDRDAAHACVWFQDLRFLTPGRDVWPFRYGACREGSGVWRAFELEGGRRAALD